MGNVLMKPEPNLQAMENPLIKEWIPDLGHRVKMTREGEIVGITDDRKLNVKFVECEAKKLKMQKITNFAGENFDINDIVIHKRTGRKGKIVMKKEGKIKVELLETERIVEGLEEDFFEPISPQMENPQEEGVEPPVSNGLMGSNGSSDSNPRRSPIETLEIVRKEDEGSVLSSIVCFIAMISCMYMIINLR